MNKTRREQELINRKKRQRQKGRLKEFQEVIFRIPLVDPLAEGPKADANELSEAKWPPPKPVANKHCNLLIELLL